MVYSHCFYSSPLCFIKATQSVLPMLTSSKLRTMKILFVTGSKAFAQNAQCQLNIANITGHIVSICVKTLLGAAVFIQLWCFTALKIEALKSGLID